MAHKNINCIYNDNGPYCTHEKVAKAFKFFGRSYGPRMCPIFDDINNKCDFKKEYPRPNFIPHVEPSAIQKSIESVCREISSRTTYSFQDLIPIAVKFQKKYEKINLKNVLYYIADLSSYENISIDTASDYAEYALQNFQSFFSHREPSPIQMPIELILGDGNHRFSQTLTNDKNPTLVISYAGEPAEIGPEFDADETLGKTDDNKGFIFKDPRVFMQFTNPASVDSLIKSLFDLKKLFKKK